MYNKKPKKTLKELSYTTIHERLRRELVTDDSKCLSCGISNKEHKEIHKRGVELHNTTGIYYNKEDYILLCHKCHRGLGAHVHFPEEVRQQLKHKKGGQEGEIINKRSYPNLKVEKDKNFIDDFVEMLEIDQLLNDCEVAINGGI